MSPSFNFVTGNPSNLTPGGAASMTDIQGPFTDLRSAINGNLDETNVPNLAAAFTTYKELFRFVATSAGANSGAGQFAMFPGMIGASTDDRAFNTADTLTIHVVVWLDPTDFNANTRTTKLRLRLVATPNAVAPAITFTAGLYPVATYSGGSATRPRVATVGAVVSGSTAAVASPGTLAAAKTDSADFNFPAAGAYVVAFQTSGAPAANSITELVAYLEMRQV